MKKSNNLLTSLELLYANHSFIAVHKEPGIPCQTKNENPPYPLDKSLEQYLNEPVKIWTRIDQPVSGLVLFFRGSSHKPISLLRILKKHYYGIVEGHPEQTQETVITNLRRDGRKMKAIEDAQAGKRSELTYTVLKQFDRYSLLKIIPVTGRFHQIRQQLAHIGHPIKGDVKYGARRKNHDRSIHLHAMKYTVQYKDEAPVDIYDYSFPNDPLWSLARELILQQKMT